ncbi:virulence-associated protein E [Sphingomonas sp. PP-CE-3G-477]|uniref:VapE domain-containing protein n=1 Tax=Sphingomonas sp. PP-CE-3G-477 TaxID=2135660 RepID=UPI000D39A252|nr:VapE domain-containing protein [Sphingomonas sp. PP-CE-3G-477]PTQ58586.1 virulence-associated protein E [Sphingomonas sp. PP-CE-3G-477]
MTTEITKQEAHEKWVARVTETLGKVPGSALEYVTLAAEKFATAISYRGSIRVEHLNGFASPYDLARDVRILAAELKLKFPRNDINDAVDRYIVDQRDSALHTLRRQFQQRQDFDWHAMVRVCFDCGEVGEDYIVAILRHLVWQVQRKIAGRAAYSHLMPVLHGPQGCGKTFWIEQFVSPLSDVTSYADFGQIADERMIDLWRSYVIVLDEMAKAGKADIETVKHIITAPTLERRPMRTNASVTITQNATLIGASNHRLAELIRDETGIRRFVELFYRRPADPDYLHTVDWHAAWASVQAEDEAPILAVADVLAEQQAGSRHHGPVEYWLLHMSDLDLNELSKLAGPDDLLSTQQLYDAYVEHRRDVTAQFDREHRSQQAFAIELHRITDADADAPIKKARTKKRNGWRITQRCAPALSLVR